MSIGVYLHIPFCVQKCLYCDFTSFVSDNHSEYFKYLSKEADMYKNILSVEKADSIFIGGGTPSSVDARYISQILKKINASADAEITIEANPGTLTSEKLKIYKDSGINRISIGLQSANDKELKSLGRIHDFNTFLKSYELAVAAGFSNINVDIMFGIPGQTAASFSKTLEEVYRLNPTHISCYSLIVEEGTPFYTMQLELPSEDEERGMYKAILDNDRGYNRYEISNFAKDGFECKHNLKYWQFEDYLGLGLSAYSFYKRERFNNFSDFKSYYSAIDKGNFPVELKEQETDEELIKDYIITSMRLSKGIDFEDFREKFGVEFEDKYKNETDKYMRTNHIRKTPGGIAFTDKGFEISNYILSDFI